jgi:hypothetical protein
VVPVAIVTAAAPAADAVAADNPSKVPKIAVLAPRVIAVPAPKAKAATVAMAVVAVVAAVVAEAVPAPKVKVVPKAVPAPPAR